MMNNTPVALISIATKTEPESHQMAKMFSFFFLFLLLLQTG